MKRGLSLLLLLLSTLLNAQEKLTSGRIHHINSAILNEQRTYWVYTPEVDSSSFPKLPVLYILDADINFQLLVAINQYLSRGRVPLTQKAIIVGILNTDRTRDLTPTHVKNGPDMKTQKGGDYSKTGGTDQFLKFLWEELKPEIEKQYHATGPSTLIGHSFGGLTSLYCFLKQPHLFDNYAAIDPSLWWDNRVITKFALDRKLSLNDKKQLYIAVSSSSVEQQQDLEQLKNHLSIIKSLDLKISTFPDEVHGTIMLPALFELLKER